MPDDCFAQQLVLGPESSVDRTGRQVGLAHDVADLRAFVPLSGEDVARRVEQALTQRILVHFVQ